MFCPNCGCEYREGYKVCSDCNIPLVDEIQEEKIDCYESYCSKLIKVITSILREMVLEIINSKIYLKISNRAYKFYILSLFIFNFLIVRYTSLWVCGPGWEIPVDLVGPIKFITKCAEITVLLCVFSFLVGYRRFKSQSLLSKIISVSWFLGSIGFAFVASDSIKLPKQYVEFIIQYWWIGMLLPLLLFSHLMYTNSRITDK